MIPVLEIGGTHVSAALVERGSAGIVPGSARRADLDAAGSAEEILATIVASGRCLWAPARAVWGVAIPGPFDYVRGIGRFEGVAKFEALNGVDVRGALADGLGAEDVAFINDAEAFLLGEWIAGAARGHRRAVGITLGTGIGSAFLADGRIIDSGPDVPPLGHVHLLKIDRRPLEETVSRRAILARYLDRADAGETPADLDIHHVAELASGGDERALDAFITPMTALGLALAPWLARFGASIMVVGGSMSRSWDLIRTPLHAALDSRIEVVVAALPDEAPLIGAARRATDWQREFRAGHT